MRYHTLVELRTELEKEIRLRGEIPPHNFTGLFEPAALDFWRRTDKSADEIATIHYSKPRPDAHA